MKLYSTLFSFPAGFCRLGFAVLVFLRVVSFAIAQDELAVRALSFDHVAQDGRGVAWGIDTQLHVFDGKDWTVKPLLFPPVSRSIARAMRAIQLWDGFSFPWLGPYVFDHPMRLTPMPDGSIACVVQLPDARFAVTRYLAGEWQVSGVCDGIIENSGLRSPPFADSHNRLWITTTSDAKIYRADPDGRVSLVVAVKPEELTGDSNIHIHYANINFSEDGHGRVWAWSDSISGGMNGAALRGVIVFDGGKMLRWEKFKGITGERYSFMGPRDDRHMWVAVPREGLYSVDIDTLEATPMESPEPGAFDWVRKIFSANDDLFVISSRTGDIFKNALWRQRAGKWACLIDNVDNRPNPYFEFTRPWLKIGKDIVFCSFDAAPWIIHEDGTVARLDFQQGFTMEDARNIMLLPDGRLLAHGATGGHIFCDKVSLGPPDPARHGWVAELVYIYHGWTTDPDGNAWIVLQDKSSILSQWDGTRWREHPFPADIRRLRFLGAGVDTRGRIWLLPNAGKTAFYDPKSDLWRTFPDLQTAFAELKADAPRFTGNRPEYAAPDYSAKGDRMAFRPISWDLVYFDGAQWRKWRRGDIDGGTNPNVFTMGQPFFDKADRLCVCIGEQVWQWDDKSQWNQVDEEAKYSDTSNGAPRHGPAIKPPEGSVTEFPDSIAADNQGAIWLTSQGKLYKCKSGDCTEVFAEGVPNPFADHRKIIDAWSDRNGNVFLKTTFDKWIMIRP